MSNRPTSSTDHLHTAHSDTHASRDGSSTEPASRGPRTCASTFGAFACALLAAAVLGLEPASAVAEAPARVPIQARLTDASGEPIDGKVEVTLALYDARQGGPSLYRETLEVEADSGSFTAYLGTNRSLDLKLFETHDRLFLGVTIEDGEELTPRIRLATAPYAAYARRAKQAEQADNASKLGGREPSDFAEPDWSDIQNVPSEVTRTYSGTSAVEVGAQGEIGLTSSCAEGEVLKQRQNTWTCAKDQHTTYSGHRAVAIDGQNRVGLTSRCAKGKILRWDGQDWTCAEDQDTTYGAGTGLALSNGRFSVDAISATEINTGAVRSPEIANQSIAARDLDRGAISSSKLKKGSVTSEKIKDGSVQSDDLAQDSVRSNEIKDRSVGSKDLEKGGVQSNNIEDGTIKSKDMAYYGCGTYARAKGCPFEDGQKAKKLPPCDKVPVGSYCESDSECGLGVGFVNCGFSQSVYIRVR